VNDSKPKADRNLKERHSNLLKGSRKVSEYSPEHLKEVDSETPYDANIDSSDQGSNECDNSISDEEIND